MTPGTMGERRKKREGKHGEKKGKRGRANPAKIRLFGAKEHPERATSVLSGLWKLQGESEWKVVNGTSGSVFTFAWRRVKGSRIGFSNSKKGIQKLGSVPCSSKGV